MRWIVFFCLCCFSTGLADPGCALLDALVEQERALDAQLDLSVGQEQAALEGPRLVLERMLERVARLREAGVDVGCFGALLWAQRHRLRRLEVWKAAPGPGTWRLLQAATRRCRELREQQSGPPRGRAAQSG